MKKVKQITFLFVVFFLLTAIFISCSNFINIGESLNGVGNSMTPFANPELLDNISQSDGVVNQFIDSGYPNKLLIRNSKDSLARSVDSATDVEVFDEYSVDEKALDFLLNASKSELKLLGIDNEVVYANYVEGQYLMHDNGADGGASPSWWEGWSVYQFQSASVIKN